MMLNRTTALYAVLLVLALAAPLAGLYPIFLMKCLCFALFACAFNLLIGFTGLLSFGHAAFFGSAAYLCGHAAKQWGLTPELAILFGAAGSAILGLIVGALAIRRRWCFSFACRHRSPVPKTACRAFRAASCSGSSI